MWGIIGGSGFENFSEMETALELDTRTPFGVTSSGLKRVRVGGIDCLFLPRHGKNHELLPTEVNSRANIWALKNSGATRVLAISAVGSLERELEPGHGVSFDQYIDRTKGMRQHSYCGGGIVGHVSLAHPTCKPGQSVLQMVSQTLDFPIHFKKSLVCVEGPTFSTQAESMSYRAMGAQTIGMTSYPEYALAREAGVCYVPLGFVTDYDCWDDSIPHVTLEGVIEQMRKNNASAFRVARGLAERTRDTYPACTCADSGLKTGLMTPPEAIPADAREWLGVLLK